MPYEDLASEPIENLLNAVKRTGHAEQAQSVAAVGARCTIELAGSLGQVWAGLHDVKKSLVMQLSSLTTELSKASEQASRQTDALVRWTRVLVFVTGAYTLITGGLLIIAIRSLGS